MPCPSCGPEGDSAGDNLRVKENGFAKCFACGYRVKNYYGNNKDEYIPREIVHTPMIETFPERYVALKNRGIPKEWCKKYRAVYVPEYLGEPAIAFSYYKDSNLTGYHIKPLSKNCKTIGSYDNADMFGSWLHNDPENKLLVITEGHEDAICCAMVGGDAMFHYTSLSNGIESVEKFIQRHYNKLTKYKGIVLSFDNAPDGDAGVAKFIKLYNQIGKIRIAKLPLKDANDMIKAGRADELKWALIKAETYKPPNIVDWDDIMDEILEKPERGIPWPWQSMTDINFGFYPGKTYLIASATDVGKSTFIKDIMFHLTEKHKINAGAFFLEHRPKELAHKLLGSKIGQDLEQPDNPWWDKDRIKLEVANLKEHVFMFDPTHGIELKDIINAIYYFVNVNKIQLVILDNLTILSENRMIDGKKVSEHEFLTEVGKQFNRVKRELGVSFFIIAHLAQDKISKQAYVSTSPKNAEKYASMTADDVNKLLSPPAITWEQGRMPSIENIYGGATTAKLAHEVWVLARNTTSENDKEFRTTKVKNLKCKNKRKGSNREFELIFNNGVYEESYG